MIKVFKMMTILIAVLFALLLLTYSAQNPAEDDLTEKIQSLSERITVIEKRIDDIEGQLPDYSNLIIPNVNPGNMSLESRVSRLEQLYRQLTTPRIEFVK